MKNLLILFLSFILVNISLAQDNPFITYCEKSGFKETPTFEETVAYCKLLDEASTSIEYTTFGKTPQGRDLPLLIIDADGISDPNKAKEAGKFILLIQAGIHPGEIDGKDAGLMFFRDLALKGLNGGVPENITFLLRSQNYKIDLYYHQN